MIKGKITSRFRKFKALHRKQFIYDLNKKKLIDIDCDSKEKKMAEGIFKKHFLLENYKLYVHLNEGASIAKVDLQKGMFVKFVDLFTYKVEVEKTSLKLTFKSDKKVKDMPEKIRINNEQCKIHLGREKPSGCKNSFKLPCTLVAAPA